VTDAEAGPPVDLPAGTATAKVVLKSATLVRMNWKRSVLLFSRDFHILAYAENLHGGDSAVLKERRMCCSD
jgi:hypothetical protein